MYVGHYPRVVVTKCITVGRFLKLPCHGCCNSVFAACRMQERDVKIDWRKQEVAKMRDQKIKDTYTPEQINAKIMVCFAYRLYIVYEDLVLVFGKS